MRRTLKIAKTMMPVALSTLVLVGAAPQVAIAAQDTQSAPVTNVLNGEYRDSNQSLPPVRETLTKEEAENLPGCEAYFDEAKKEFVIRPKNGANEGVISYSLENKKADFEKIRMTLIFKDSSHDDVPVRFDKRVYIYDSTNPSGNDTLFYQVHVKTINITDNLNIKFAKNLAAFFMQNFRKAANHLHYIKGIENWDTSNVESMEKMFNLASQLEGKLDLSKWNVSKVDKFNLMFSGVGNDNFVLDFSNKNFRNSADVVNMFNSFGGVLVANNWTVEDPNGSSNPIQNLMNSTSSILTHWDQSAHAYTGPSCHLLITDNPIILKKNETAKYKFYKKVKVIYKTNGTEKSVELELPAVYDSRIDADGKPDASKAASNDPMNVVRPQIADAIKQAVKDLRDQNPGLNLPENVIPVPVHDLKDAKSPIELFQDYYLGLVKEETIKAKTTYTADSTLKYKEVVTDTKAVDGKKQVITGAMKDGAWDPDAKTETEITKVVNGVARVGNQTTTVTVLEPGITYVADGNLAYNTTETQSEGVKGTSTSIDTYEVNSETGLTNTLDHHDMRIKKATNKVVKVGNKEVKTEDIQPGTVYEADSSLTYKQQQTTEGTKGTKTTTTIYKVDENTGLTNTVQSSESKTTTPAKDKVIKVGNVKTETEVIKCKTIYIADDTLAYEAKEDKTAGKDGSKTVTTTYKVNKTTGLSADVEDTQEKKVDPTDHVVRVGNKQVTHEGDKTITTTYDVDPNTGKLTNPKKHTSMPAGNLTPAKNLPKTVTFKDGDKQVASVKVEKGQAIATDNLTDQSMPKDPIKSGYTFKGWNTKADGQGTAFTGTTTVDNDLTVYAMYTQNPVTPQPPTPSPLPTPTPVPTPVPTPTPTPVPTPSPLPVPTPQQPAPTPVPALPSQPAQTLAPEHPLAKTHAPKHMRADVLPKTGETSLLGTLLAALGLSITGLGVLYKKKTPRKGKHLSE